MTGRAGRTGAEPTVLSALEQNIPRDRRILVDALAPRVLPWWSRALVRLAKPFMDPLLKAAERSAAPGMWGALLCRKRYIDERLIESAARVDQIVNLGAGLDTRLYRLNAVHSLPAWELDQAANIRQKRRRFSRALHRIPPTIRLVPIDFDHEPVAQVLAGNGYDAGKRTFFLWEAVTQYLTTPAIESTFTFLSGAAPGSLVAFSYVHQDFLDGTDLFGWPSGYDGYVRKGLWLHGMRPEEVSGELSRWGYRLLDDADYADLADRYIRPTGRALTVSTIEHVVFAEKR